MSQVITGVVGAAVGFMVGGPLTGAMIGFSIGMAAGAPAMQVPGNRLGEISKQTAKEGDPRTIVWGTVRPIGGNVIASQDPPRIVRKKKKSGKGGGSETTEENVYRTYAIGVCEGPITAFLRIWRNNKLVYDGRPGSTWGTKNNATFLKKARLYLGGYDQLPDSALEAVWVSGDAAWPSRHGLHGDGQRKAHGHGRGHPAVDVRGCPRRGLLPDQPPLSSADAARRGGCLGRHA